MQTLPDLLTSTGCISLVRDPNKLLMVPTIGVFRDEQSLLWQGIGDTGVNIFFREAQLQWDELFPYADASSLKLARDHGYPGKSAKELAEFVGNDK